MSAFDPKRTSASCPKVSLAALTENCLFLPYRHEGEKIMQRILIGLALVLVALPAGAQISKEEFDRCSGLGTGVGIPAEARVGYCTQLIEGGRLSPRNLAITYNNRGNDYEKMGQYDQEIADDTKAIQIDPNYALSYNNRAWAYHLKGQDAQGLPDAEKAIALDPKDGSAFETRGEIYEKLGQRDKAIADYRATLQLPPSNDSSMEDATAGLKRLGVTP
jgi:tetratricopeptide (TPR) repeat protein